MLTFRWSVNLARALRILPQSTSIAQEAEERFLIVNLTPHLGDSIMMMPMIESLRKAHPQSRIECAVEASIAPLLREMPIVDCVYALRLGNIPPITRALVTHRILRIAQYYRQQMRCSAPTTCVMPRWGDDLFRSNILGYLTGARRRIGFASDVSAAQQHPLPYRDALLTELIHGGRGVHEPEKFCLLLREAGLIPNANSGEASTQVIASLQHIADKTDWPNLAERVGVDRNLPFAVVAPGASMPKRQWPIEYWAEVMADLRAKDMKVVVLTGAPDANLAKQLHELSGGWATLVAGKTSVVESVALISHAKMFFGNDSGPGHIAGALGVPTFILFIAEENCDPDGPSAPERIHPIGPHVVFCRPAKCLPPCVSCCEAEEAHCIKTILPSDVIESTSRKRTSDGFVTTMTGRTGREIEHTA
ncbi:glycosyltransferase family 9 protein [Edaphobacter sp. DSM 109919]